MARAYHRAPAVAAAAASALSFPAALPGVVAVAASDAAGNRWPKSESGPYLGLTAPGVDIYAAGVQGSHQQATGTSFAAPQVAAAAALLRARYPQENAAQIISRLTTTAHRTGRGRSAEWGFGIIDPYQALTAPAGSAAAANPVLEPLADAPPQAPAARSGRPAWVWPVTGAVVAAAALLGLLSLRRRLRSAAPAQARLRHRGRLD